MGISVKYAVCFFVITFTVGVAWAIGPPTLFFQEATPVNPGPPADVVIYPTADGAFSYWDASTGVINWAMVDDTPHDGDSTYLWVSDTSKTQCFGNLPNLPDGEVILGVSIVATFRNVVGDMNYLPRMHVQSTLYNGIEQDVSGAVYVEHSYEWTTNPATGAAWTEADVEGTGLNAIDDWCIYNSDANTGDELRSTQVKLVVRYN